MTKLLFLILIIVFISFSNITSARAAHANEPVIMTAWNVLFLLLYA